MSTVQRYLPLAGRILIALIFLWSGIGKITNPGMMMGYIASAGLPMPEVGLGIAILIEVGGSLLLILGYQTRLVALALAIFCVVTAAAFHKNFADMEQMINFLKNVSMAGGLLQVVAFGAGGLSIDARRGK